MNHLDALCCDGCRAKVAAIEERDRMTGSNLRTSPSVDDRRELLKMFEQLLGTVATLRERWATEGAMVRAVLTKAVEIELQIHARQAELDARLAAVEAAQPPVAE